MRVTSFGVNKKQERRRSVGVTTQHARDREKSSQDKTREEQEERSKEFQCAERWCDGFSRDGNRSRNNKNKKDSRRAKTKKTSREKQESDIDMSSTTQNTMTTIPKWNGDPRTAEAWIYKFTAACTLKTVDGHPCTKVIREEFESELPTDENEALDENNDSDKKKILALKQNEQVMAMLMIAMNTDEGMSKVMQEMQRSPIFQTGQAWRVIKMIQDDKRRMSTGRRHCSHGNGDRSGKD